MATFCNMRREAFQISVVSISNHLSQKRGISLLQITSLLYILAKI